MSQYCPGYCPSPFPILPVSILLASMLATLQHDKFLLTVFYMTFINIEQPWAMKEILGYGKDIFSVMKYL